MNFFQSIVFTDSVLQVTLLKHDLILKIGYV